MDERLSLKQIRHDGQNSTTSDIKETSDNNSDINKNNQPPNDWSDEAINPPKDDPVYFFKLFLKDEIMNFLVEETNHYAEKVIKQITVKQNSKFNDWKPTDTDKMEVFIGLLVHIRLVNLSCLKVVSTTFLLVCFLSLKEGTWETRKNAFYFTSKALFILEKIKF